MKLIQAILLRLIALGAAAAGLALLFLEPSALYDLIVLPMPESVLLRMLLGALAMAIGLAAVLPLPRTRNKRKIAFPGEHGRTVFQLETVEATLTKSLAKISEVKKPRVKLLAAPDKRRVRVEADVALVKAAGESAREVTNRVTRVLSGMARGILGDDEVVAVDLHVRSIDVKGGLEHATASPASEAAQAASGTKAHEPVAVEEAPAPREAAPKAIGGIYEDKQTEPHTPMPGAVPEDRPAEVDIEDESGAFDLAGASATSSEAVPDEAQDATEGAPQRPLPEEEAASTALRPFEFGSDDAEIALDDESEAEVAEAEAPEDDGESSGQSGLYAQDSDELDTLLGRPEPEPNDPGNDAEEDEDDARS